MGTACTWRKTWANRTSPCLTPLRPRFTPSCLHRYCRPFADGTSANRIEAKLYHGRMTMRGWENQSNLRPADASELRYVYVVRTVLGAFVQCGSHSSLQLHSSEPIFAAGQSSTLTLPLVLTLIGRRHKGVGAHPRPRPLRSLTPHPWPNLGLPHRAAHANPLPLGNCRDFRNPRHCARHAHGKRRE